MVNTQIISQKQAVKDFVEYFSETFGTVPIVIYTLKATETVFLDTLKQVVSLVLESSFPGQFAQKLDTKSRKQTLVEYRQVYCKVALDMDYSASEIARSLKMNHATVLHACTKVNNLLKQNDTKIFYIYQQVLNQLKTLSNNEGNIQNPKAGENQPKSDLSVV